MALRFVLWFYDPNDEHSDKYFSAVDLVLTDEIYKSMNEGSFSDFLERLEDTISTVMENAMPVLVPMMRDADIALVHPKVELPKDESFS